MSIREWAAFGIDLLHILLLSAVYVAALVVVTALARVRKAYLGIRSPGRVRSEGRPTWSGRRNQNR